MRTNKQHKPTKSKESDYVKKTSDGEPLHSPQSESVSILSLSGGRLWSDRKYVSGGSLQNRSCRCPRK